jgi:hypothetical protein
VDAKKIYYSDDYLETMEKLAGKVEELKAERQADTSYDVFKIIAE